MRWLIPILAAAIPGAAAAQTSEIADRIKPSVVHLELYDAAGEKIAQGTGFFVSEDGLIVTNDHVVRPAHGAQALLHAGGERTVVGVMARDPDRDVAVIKVDGDGYAPLELDPLKELNEGMKVIVVGNPRGLAWTVSEGIISALRPTGIPEELRPTTIGGMLQITAEMAPGSSGSPVVTDDGKVIGVGQSIIVGGGALNFAVPVEAATALLATIGPGTRPRSFNEDTTNNLIISLAVFGLLGLAYVGYRMVRRARFEKKAAGVRVVPPKN